MLYDNDTIEFQGSTFRVNFENDDCYCEPWIEDDGHGPVSKWTRDPKRPGERVLVEDRGSFRYYDFREAVQIAKRDGWDAEPYGKGTRGERAARAAEADFRHLRAFCRGDWSYLAMTVELLDDEGEPTGEFATLGGVASSEDHRANACELAAIVMQTLQRRGHPTRDHSAILSGAF
jgi:hypothetical protein